MQLERLDFMAEPLTATLAQRTITNSLDHLILFVYGIFARLDTIKQQLRRVCHAIQNAQNASGNTITNAQFALKISTCNTQLNPRLHALIPEPRDITKMTWPTYVAPVMKTESHVMTAMVLRPDA